MYRYFAKAYHFGPEIVTAMPLATMHALLPQEDEDRPQTVSVDWKRYKPFREARRIAAQNGIKLTFQEWARRNPSKG